MADPLGPVNPGDDMEITAVAWNAAMDAAREFRQPSRPDVPKGQRRPSGNVETLAKNETGVELLTGQVAMIAGVSGFDLADPRTAFDWLRGPVISLGVPESASDRIVVTLEPIPVGKSGRVVIEGLAWCDIDLGSATTAKFAKPVAGETGHLARALKGPIQVVAVSEGEEEIRRCAVLLGGCCGDGAGDDPSYPLQPMPCLVDGGMAQLWIDPETGEATCRTTGDCACPPAEPDPPDPATSCCSLWYCTPDGPVEVSADAEGVYTPPEDWDGSEPHLSEAAALLACPIPDDPMPTCEDVSGGDADYLFEGGDCAGAGDLDGYTGTATYMGEVGGVYSWYDGGGGPCASDGGIVSLTCIGDVWSCTVNSAGGGCTLTLDSWTATSLTFVAPAGPCGSWFTGPFSLTIAW